MDLKTIFSPAAKALHSISRILAGNPWNTGIVCESRVNTDKFFSHSEYRVSPNGDGTYCLRQSDIVQLPVQMMAGIHTTQGLRPVERNITPVLAAASKQDVVAELGRRYSESAHKGFYDAWLKKALPANSPAVLPAAPAT